MNEYTLSIAHAWQGLGLESAKECQQVDGRYWLQAFISLQFMNSGWPFLVILNAEEKQKRICGALSHQETAMFVVSGATCIRVPSLA